MLGRLDAASLGLALGLTLASGCAEHSTTRVCTAKDLQLDQPRRDGMIFQPAGSAARGVLHFKNFGKQTCTVVGQPRVRLIATPGAPRLVQGPARLNPGLISIRRLPPGSAAFVDLAWLNWCGRGSNEGGRPGPMPRSFTLILRGRTLGRFGINGTPPCYAPQEPSFIAITNFFSAKRSVVD